MKKIIKDILKRIIPNKVIQYIRLGKDIGYYSDLMRQIEKNPNEYDYIMGTPLHTNLGDHLITLAEKHYLDKIGYKRRIIEVPSEMFQVYKVRLRNAIPKNSLIFINGGGWMGNLWTKEELLLQEMVDTFKDNRVIIFPQTIYYDDNKFPYEELIDSGYKVFSACTRLLLCVRDRQSYEFACEYYKNVNVILVPDIALEYYEVASNIRCSSIEHIAKFCLRTDRELHRNYDIEEQLKQLLTKRGYEIENINTIAKHRISRMERDNAVKQVLKNFSTCQLVITDRLHGMIFAYLAGTPCIVMDNKTKKISGVYNAWLRQCANVFPIFADFNEKQTNTFIDFIQMQEEHGLNFELDFKKLEEEIISG